ncbi:cyclic GMP-AMP synthase isoform X2 [Rhinoderma darwinii]|uniref:cyclic GMP-AMP synthase isoform X2 n=1 Tax=Rhinoderma darwinii TaxID=43563 RepID=UPI003F669481
MDGRRQPGQQKEMSTRPKEPKSRGRPAPRTSDDAVTSTVKRDSDKMETYKSSEVDNKCNGRSSGRKNPQKKLPRVQQGKNNPAHDRDESNPLPITSSRKQSVKDTSEKRAKSKGTSSGNNDMMAQFTSNVRYPVNALHSATTTEKKLSKTPNNFETNLKTEDQTPIVKTKHKSSHIKSNENGQCQEKVTLEKKVSGKTHKEKTNISNFDNGEVTEPKRKDVSTPRRLKDVVEGKLRLKMDDISKAAQKVNKVVNTILTSEKLIQDSPFKAIEKMSTGSYYEHLKISKPNEFDIMLGICQKGYPTIILTNLDDKGPFYTLAFKDRKPEAMHKYIKEPGGNISASEIANEFRNRIKQIIDMPGMEGVSLQRKVSGSPAVTLIIKNEPQDISVDLVLALKIISNWPEQTNGGLNIDVWLGTKVKQTYKKSHFFMVPKPAMMGNKTVNADTWRISFSNIEKKIITNHGNGKTCCESGGGKKEMCCRKQCLKLLKYLLELFKNNGCQRKMSQFCSYHAKTALLHHCAQNPKDEVWKLEDLEFCFNRYVSFFQDCLSRSTLYNFFIPSHNLFSAEFVDTSNCDYLCKEIEKQKANNYPIFYD